MWRYRQPGFALLLLRELQKQQHGSLHCDILLQTEGVSVPAHGCVLSALSPVFSRALANSPLLPAGQSRLVKLHAVGANALLKLVGFIYSGEMAGEGFGEQEEVIDVAHRLGFSNLIDGKKRHMTGHQDKAVRWREIGLQTEMEKQAPSPLVLTEGQRFIHAGSQTDSPKGNLTDACCVSEPVLSLAQPPVLASMSSEYSTISPLGNADLLNDTAAASLSSLSETPAGAHSKCCQEMEKKKGKNPKMLDQLSKESLKCKQIKLLNIKTESKLLNSGVLEGTKGIGGKDFRKLIKKLGFQNSTAFEQSEDTQISLKIKLKRRTSGALWEIVSIHEESRADESSMCGSAASERCHTGPGMMHSDCELVQNQRTCPGVQGGPSPALLGTVTLTPPSDLNTSSPATPARPPSEKSHLPTHDPGLLSSPLQMQSASQGLPQAEESDENFAMLLEDMVMMGINILPSESTDGNSMHHLNQLCSNLDPQIGLCEAAPYNCLCVCGDNIAARGRDSGKIISGSSGQQAAGSECTVLESQSGCRTVELKNMASVASYPGSFVTSPCITPQKDTHSSSTFLCTVSEKVPASTLPACTAGLQLPHQNVGEVLDNFFWTADNHVQLMKEGLSNTSEGLHGNVHTSKVTTSRAAHNSLDRVNIVTETNRDLANSTPVKNPPYIMHQVSFKQAQAIVEAPNSDEAEFNEMRLPRCLSPLASEKEESSTLRPLEMSSWLSVSSINPQPSLKISSPQPQAFSGKTDQVNPSCTPLYVKQSGYASLSSHDTVLSNSSCNFRPNKGYLEGATKSRLGQITTQSWSHEKPTSASSEDRETDRPTDKVLGQRISTKRCSVEAMANEQDRKRTKKTAYNSNVVQMVKIMKPWSVNKGAVASIDATQQTHNTCPKKMDWLRSGKSLKRVSTEGRSLENQAHCKTTQPFKCGKQSESKEEMDEKEPTLVAKCGCGRPPKKANCAAGFVQKLSKVRKLNDLYAGFDYFSSADDYNLQFTQRVKTAESVQNEGQVVLKHGRPHKKGKHALAIPQSVTKIQDVNGLSKGFAKGKVNNGCEDSTAQEPEMNTSSYSVEELSTDVNTETTKQPIKHASQAQRPSIVDCIFHHTIYSKGKDNTLFLAMDQHARPSFQNAGNFETTERKNCAEPPPPLTVKKFREFIEQGPVQRRKLTSISGQEEKDATGESTADRTVAVDGKAEQVVDRSKNKKADSESSTVNSEELNISFKSQNGCLIGGNCETNTGKIQADKTMNVNFNSIHLSSHSINLNTDLGSELYSVPFINTFEVKNGSRSESSQITEYPLRSEDITNTVTSVENSKVLAAEKDLKGEQISESFCEILTSECSETVEVASDKTGDFYNKDSESIQIVKPDSWNEKVGEHTEKEAVYDKEITKNNEHGAAISGGDLEVVDETAQVTTGHGHGVAHTEWSNDETGMEGNHSSSKITDGQARAEERELSGPRFLKTHAEVISSDEALTQTPTSTSVEDLSVQLVEEPEQAAPSNPPVNTMDPSSVSAARVKFESTENWDCDEDEEVVVDDVWGFPSVLPHSSISQPFTTILDEDTEDDLGEEEEVDVTGDETN